MDGMKDRKTLHIEDEEDTDKQTIRKDEDVISIEDKFNSSMKDLAKEIREVNQVVNGNLPETNVALIPSPKYVKEEQLVHKR